MSWLDGTEDAHTYAVGAATEGLRDPGLGRLRLAGSGVPTLAEAAVSSATPFLRAPLLAAISEALLLHPVDLDGPGAVCPTCREPAPCPTARTLWPL